jgi:hypothetical protein
VQRYEDQLRILREPVVELRTNVQILKVKSEQPVVLPSAAAEPEPQEQAVDEAALRMLRRKVDSAHRDLEAQVQEVRRELYEFMLRPQERIVERVVEVRTVQERPPERPREVAPVREIDVDLNMAKARAFLSKFDDVLKVTKLADLPEAESLRGASTPLVWDPLRPPARPPVEFRLERTNSPRS